MGPWLKLYVWVATLALGDPRRDSTRRRAPSAPLAGERERAGPSGRRMPGGAIDRDRSRSRSRGTARRSRRAGREVRDTGRLSAAPVVWTEPGTPDWFTRLSVQLQRLPPEQKERAARLLDQLAGVLEIQAGRAN